MGRKKKESKEINDFTDTGTSNVHTTFSTLIPNINVVEEEYKVKIASLKKENELLRSDLDTMRKELGDSINNYSSLKILMNKKIIENNLLVDELKAKDVLLKDYESLKKRFKFLSKQLGETDAGLNK